MKHKWNIKLLGVWFAVLALFMMSRLGYAEFGITHSKMGPIIELSDQTRDAIDSGLSLTFVSEYAKIENYLLFDWAQIQHQHTYRISRHALSDRYHVHIDQQLKPAIFRSSAQGVAYISKAIHRQFRSYAVNNPSWQLRITLDKLQLPAPMRLTAFVSKDWRFNSGWSLWQSER